MTARLAIERRRYWLSLAALAVVLPTAVAVHSWGSVSEWRSRHDRDPLPVARGAVQSYAGAEWRLTGLTRLPGNSPDATVVLAEFEATTDAKLPADSLCQVMLTDAEGRRWEPVFLTEPIVRKMHPEVVEKPRCGTFAFEGVEKDGRVKMAETFVVPDAADGLALAVTMSGALPRYLLLK